MNRVSALFRGAWVGLFVGAILFFALIVAAVVYGLASDSSLDWSLVGFAVDVTDEGGFMVDVDLRPALLMMTVCAVIGGAAGFWLAHRRRRPGVEPASW